MAARPHLPPVPPSAGGAAEDRRFCRAMLPRVSRTFAACIALLPPPVDHQVLVAYLLCRIADTAEDTADLPVADKRALLSAFAAAVDGCGDGAVRLRTAFAVPRSDDELLAREADAVLRELDRLGEAPRTAIRPWVREMCEGMAAFAGAHADAAPGRLVSLASEEELERYCWYVAGTVGHLLTGLFRLHAPEIDAGCASRLSRLATGFGLGLQLTNIIKDVADDRQRGWSFVPIQLCREEGLAPESLLDPACAVAAGRIMGRLIARARGYLEEALDYCCTLPCGEYRLRLFCLAPHYMAVRTLALAARDPRLLDPSHKVKITRGAVYRTLAMAHIVAPSNALVRAYHRHLARGAG